MKSYFFIHGEWQEKKCWSKVIGCLAKSGICAHSIDLPGHGTRKHAKDVLLGDYIDCCISYIEEKCLRNIVLVGYGFAGIIISGIAGEIPEKISNLVYINSAVLDNECFLDTLPAKLAEKLKKQAESGQLLSISGKPLQPAFPFFEKVFYKGTKIPKIYISSGKKKAIAEKALKLLKCRHISIEARDIITSNPELLARTILSA